MRRALLRGPGRIDVVDVPVPSPAKSEVVVRIVACGVCGSDLHLFGGRDPWRSSSAEPVTVGHETSGVVSAVGPGVTTVRPGDVVAIEPAFLLACRDCRHCAAGRSELCLSRGRWGDAFLGVAGFADHELVPARSVHSVPAGLSTDVAALADIYACALHATAMANGDGPVAVIGTGAIGLATAQVARARGLGPITLFARREAAAAAARRAGEPTVHLVDDDVQVDAATVFDCAGGAGDSMQQALRQAAKGGTVCVLGAFWGDVPVPYHLANAKEITVRFSSAYSQTGPYPEFPAALELLAAGSIDGGVDGAALITHTFPLDRIADAFRTAADKHESAAIRVLVKP